MSSLFMLARLPFLREILPCPKVPDKLQFLPSIGVAPHLHPLTNRSSPFTHLREPILRPACFQINAGMGPPSLPANLRTCQRSNVSWTYPLSFHIVAHSFACPKTQLFFFNRFRTLCAKTPGWGRVSKLNSPSCAPCSQCLSGKPCCV